MSRTIRSLLVLMVVAGSVFTIVGCQPAATPEPTKPPEVVPTKAPEEVPTKPPAEAVEEVFKLGVLGPFSGPSARTGDEFKGAVNIAFDAINWQIGNYKIDPKQKLLRLVYAVDAQQCGPGENTVGVCLVQRAKPGTAAAVQLEKLELHVRYS